MPMYDFTVSFNDGTALSTGLVATDRDDARREVRIITREHVNRSRHGLVAMVAVLSTRGKLDGEIVNLPDVLQYAVIAKNKGGRWFVWSMEDRQDAVEGVRDDALRSPAIDDASVVFATTRDRARAECARRNSGR